MEITDTFTSSGSGMFVGPASVYKDCKISVKSKGIFGVILAMGTCKFADILSCCSEGKDALYESINELIDAGYILREDNKKSDGTYAGVRYMVHWNTITASGKPASGKSGNGEKDTYLLKDIKLHSSESENSEVLSEKVKTVSRVGKPGNLPKTKPELVKYLSYPDPSEYIDDITDEDDMMTLKTVYADDTWQHRFAVNFWNLGIMYGFLTVPQWMKRTLVIQQWADEFDKIIRTKKATKAQLILVLQWLINVDEFWLKKGNLASPAKFNKSYRKDGCNFLIDLLLRRAMKDLPPPPTPRTTYTAGQVEELMKLYGSDLTMDDFKSRGDNKYMYIPEHR